MRERVVRQRPTEFARPVPSGEPAMPAPDRRLATWYAAVIAIGAMICACVRLASTDQSDFTTYYYAAAAFEEGRNPYDVASLRPRSGGKITHGFVYPPHTLLLFRPLLRLGYAGAYWVYLGAKVVSLAMLVWLWYRFAPVASSGIWALLVTALLGHRQSVLLDIAAGNVSLFEQVLLWAGFLLLVRKKEVAGGASILLSSTFKIVTAAFGPMVFLVGRSRRALLTCLALTAGLCLCFAASCALWPSLWREFASAAMALDERARLNPSALALIRDIGERAGAASSTVWLAYGLCCAAVAGLWLYAATLAWRIRDGRPMVYLAVLAYALIAPRMKDYSQIVTLLPTLHVIGAVMGGGPRSLLACVILWVPLFQGRLVFGVPVFQYQPLFVTLWVFVELVVWLAARRGDRDATLGPLEDPLRGLSRMCAVCRASGIRQAR